MKKAYLGGRLRHLREARGMTQSDLAKALDISPSYLNQIERNQRPLTVQVLLKINATFDQDLQFFSEDADARLMAELREAMQDMAADVGSAAQRDLVANAPNMARAVVALYRRAKLAEERANLLGLRTGAAGGSVGVQAPFEEVRDLFYQHRNHFQTLDTAAEAVSREEGFGIGAMAAGIAQRLNRRHGVRLTLLPGDDPRGSLRRYDAATRTLFVSGALRAAQQAFQLATHLAFIEQGDAIDAILADAAGLSAEAKTLGRIGLANYFAGALLLPYGLVLQTAEETGYDIELLGQRFGVGFETASHRLSTLQRPDAPGVPFFFLRVDRAGNISKRQSATDFHFSRVGGSCPLWIVHSAFDRPGEIMRQIAEMPDGRLYFWVSCSVKRGAGGYGTPGKVFAIALGCDLRHAERLVYARGLDLTAPSSVTPIGLGCKVCERENCAQRAFPMLGQPLSSNDGESRFAPYS